MTVTHKGTYTVYFFDTNEERHCVDLAEAHRVAQARVGNRSYAKPIRNEETYLYGPGDGTTSVMIREDVEFV